VNEDFFTKDPGTKTQQRVKVTSVTMEKTNILKGTVIGYFENGVRLV
jgi:hypothetical protein